MHFHILGIGGTFMSGLGILAKALGHTVTGADQALYPPISHMLRETDIPILEGYEVTALPKADQYVIGNVIRRGNPQLEWLLQERLPIISGPEWLHQYVLRMHKNVLAVSGTHGKTTTSSMLAFILEMSGKAPSFLIGGIPKNFNVSAKLGTRDYFVVEADEYDSAFFDKRPKFLHYWPQVLIINNLEFDHADIYENFAAIKKQFHHLLRTLPENTTVVYHNESAIQEVLQMGLWSKAQSFGHKAEWQFELKCADASRFEIYANGKRQGMVSWDLIGRHNASNALASIAAAYQVGISPQASIDALCQFAGVKRRLEQKAAIGEISLYDDFAHHPTAIAQTLKGLRAKIGSARLVVALEFSSYSMRTGLHKTQIPSALLEADAVVCRSPKDWDLDDAFRDFKKPYFNHPDTAHLVKHLKEHLRPGDHLVMMSNSGFDGLDQKLLSAMKGYINEEK